MFECLITLNKEKGILAENGKIYSSGEDLFHASGELLDYLGCVDQPVIERDSKKNDVDRGEMEKSQMILEVEFCNKQKKRFLKFFTFQSLFRTRNAEFFKDIADFRNGGFKGKESSWPLYESSL